MKILKFLFLIPLLSIFVMHKNALAQQKPTSGFVVKANIKNWPTSDVFIQYWIDDEKVYDSAKVVNGEFILKGKVGDPVLLYLFPKAKDYFPTRAFYVENANITVDGDFKSPMEWVIKGSRSQDEGHVLKMAHEPFKSKRDELSAAKKAKLRDGADVTDINNDLTLVNKSYDSVTVAFIRNNPNSYISLYNIANLYFAFPLDKVSSLYEGLSKNIRNTYYGKTVAKKISSMKSVQVGNIAPNFSLPDTSGKTINLADFRGKYVLIDFWASWCGPCRAENPNVKRTYDNFKSKNFTVLGVSLDKPGAKMRWVQAINNDHLTWTQVSDLKEFASPVAQSYGIEAIPSNFLLDPNGKIIAHNLRGEQLQKELNKWIK